LATGVRDVSEAAVQLHELRDTDLRRLADQLLETRRVEYVDEGVLLVMKPPGFEHRMIMDSLNRAFYTSLSADWRIHSQDFQWELTDGSKRFYVPDLVVVRPGATPDDERAAIAMIVEVTSPTSPDTVLNDRATKPKEYAKAGVPLYLLVDQERGEWTLFGLAEGWQRYQVAAGGKYGEQIPLPPPFGFAIETSDWPRYRD
jgi:Uma2 family endonuclease